MAKTISKPTSSTKKKVEAGTGHPEPVEQGKQGEHTEPVVVEAVVEEPVVVPPKPMTIEEKRIIGEDYILTPMIYGEEVPRVALPTDVLPDSDGQLQGVTDPLQLFVNLYQPSEVVTKARFRNLLLTVLNNWKNNG
jgi:hypothetical protein